MDTVFKVGYSLVVAILLVLVVILGMRTFYDEPKNPNSGPQVTYGPDFTMRQMSYEDDRADYFRNVFILANVLGVAAVAAGVYLFRRVEAMPLGLLLGGVGVVIYGWVESARGPGETSTAPLFAVVAVGLVIVLGFGYWVLGKRGSSGESAD